LVHNFTYSIITLLLGRHGSMIVIENIQPYSDTT
jgi:hypothetical protein